MAIYNQNTNFSNEERYLKNLMMTTDNVKEANWAKNELSKLYESAGLSGQVKDWEEGAENRTAADKAARDKQNVLLSKGSKDVNGMAAGYWSGQIPGQHEMRDIYGTVTGVKRPSQEQENRDQGRNSREENFDIRKPGLNGGFDSLGREASANELTPDEQRLIETIFAAAEQVRQEKKAGNTQESSGLSSDHSSSGKTITGAVENDIGGKTGSGSGVINQTSKAGQDIEVRATNLSQGNSVDYDNTTGDITIVTDEGYKTILKKGKDYYIGSDNKAYYINDPSMAVKTFGGQDNDWQFSEDGTKLTNKATGYVLDEGKDYYTGADGVAYYYSDVRASNAAKGTGVDYDPKGRISLNYIDGSSGLLREGEQYYIGADGKAHYFSGPPSPNPEGMDDDDGDPLWLVDDIFEGWDDEDDEISYAPYNDDDDDDWGDVLDDDDLPGYVDIENAKWDDGRDEEDGGEDSGTLKDGDLKYLKLSSGDNGNANVNNNQEVEVVSSNQSQGNSVVLDRGRIYIYTTNNRKIELVEGKDYYYKNGTAYYYNQPYNAVAYRLGQGNIQFNKSEMQGQSTITVKRNNNKDYTLYEGKDYYIGSDDKAYFYSGVRARNEAIGNSVLITDGSISYEASNNRVYPIDNYFIGKDGKAYYLDGPPAPYGEGSSESSSIGTGKLTYSDDFAAQLGAVSIPDNDKEELLNLDLVNLLARTIYAEQTQIKENGQEAVAWTIINRVLSNSKEFIGSKETDVNIYNVITKYKAYTCLDGEGGNLLAYRSISGDEEGWQNAVQLAVNIINVLDIDNGELDKNDARNALESVIKNKIGKGCWYLATTTFNEKYDKEKGTVNGHKIDVNSIERFNGNTFFNYDYIDN